ncbi:SDR family NAD(P)-dependent oxidoreductase [Sphingomonas parva]|uniref:SDR family NAD(P)-dependent oxidoreductase n=1 Tax=Sphingomonas parva TaxID=2555898 RepID=A0A4Y8ZNG9_9SPHN|nr:SDR family oxidoreductase [Sphingomonas parva]TFI57560.1 SDR family NAD(P)-dependent oxidoreductase [Sphingomonas parva]
MRILILGGYGVFGGRLARLLADVPTLELVIAGRDLARAEAFCAGWTGAARVRPLALDRAEVAAGLQAERPDLVVDASGPFQHYGADPYRVIAACIAARVDYCDFADAADFVFGVPRFDAAARAAGVFVLSGVSSFPVLTAAVLREMAKDMEIVSVEGGIAPSPFAGIGRNVMRAVLGYAGAPVKLTRGGRPGHGIGLAESRRFTIAVPGRLPLRNIRFSLVDVPDLQVLPPEHPAMRDIWMGAGPVPEILHRILNLLAAARARLRLPSLVPFARLFHFVLDRMRFGEHRGGMYVRAEGVANGGPVVRSWHLIAEGDDGPLIPSMAIEAIVRKLLAGERPPPGARSGARALALADYAPLFAGRRIFTGFRDAGEEAAPLYRRILGSAFDGLPSRLRQLHDSMAPRRWSGTAEVRRGRHPLARLVAALFRFPPAAAQVPVSVAFAPRAGGAELWTRRFAGRSFASLQAAGTGRNRHLLVERFGLASFALALVVEGDRLLLVPRRWSLAGVPMPRALLPRGTSFEAEQDGRFAFDVEIALPLVGRIVAYRGTLAPDGPPAPNSGTLY